MKYATIALMPTRKKPRAGSSKSPMPSSLSRAASTSRKSTLHFCTGTVPPPAAEYGAGLKLAIERGWLDLHQSGTYAAFTPAGAELLA